MSTAFEALILRDIAGNRPAAGKPGRLFYDTTNGKWQRDTGSAWEDCEPAAGSSLSNSNISPTTSNVTAAVGTRYFADISGLTADRNFVLPTCATGDEIELKITVGDDTYELIIIGNTGVTIEGGSAATEWSRLFISGEVIHLVADGTNSWRVTYDGRIPCKGVMTLSAAETTNTAAADTTPTWDNKVIDIGWIGDTTNFRFNVRRAGYYCVSGSYLENSAITDQKYIAALIYQNATSVSEAITRAANTSANYSLPLPPKDVLCAVGDTLTFKYNTEEANRGMLNNAPRSFFQVEEVF